MRRSAPEAAVVAPGDPSLYQRIAEEVRAHGPFEGKLSPERTLLRNAFIEALVVLPGENQSTIAATLGCSAPVVKTIQKKLGVPTRIGSAQRYGRLGE